MGDRAPRRRCRTCRARLDDTGPCGVCARRIDTQTTNALTRLMAPLFGGRPGVPTGHPARTTARGGTR